ncbi:MAG TPA: hypothetical protein VGD04_05395 [Methylophilus sp.]
MFKRFIPLFAYLLLLLMPLQALATANMLVCNSMMQAHVSSHSVESMPCHQDVKSTTSSHDDQQQTPAKAHCISVCANVCAMTAVSTKADAPFIATAIQLIDFKSIDYRSVTLPNLQRPPIFLI